MGEQGRARYSGRGQRGAKIGQTLLLTDSAFDTSLRHARPQLAKSVLNAVVDLSLSIPRVAS